MNRYERDALLKAIKIQLMDVELKLDNIIEFFGIEKERNPFNVGGMTDEMKDDCIMEVDIKDILGRFNSNKKARAFLSHICTEYWRKKFTKK